MSLRPTRPALAAAFSLLLLVLFETAALAALDVPFLAARVNDQAGLLTPEEEERIEARLAAHEAATGHQVAVLTSPSLEGEVLEDYALRVAETWELGRAGHDDGVLLLVARDDRKMRLEVGYGLEGTLTDAQAGRILDEIVRPRFRAGDFAGGIETGVAATVGTLEGEAGAIDAVARRDAWDGSLGARIAAGGFFFLVIGVFAFVGLFSKGFQGWFMLFFLVPFWFGFGLVFLPEGAGPIVLGTWLVAFPLARLWLARSAPGRRFLKRHPGLVRFASSSGGGGGGGGGGFSGGGGSFGGGGASSSW